MASRKRSSSRRRSRSPLRWVWGLLQVVLIVAGVLAVAVYVSRYVPPATEGERNEPVSVSTSGKSSRRTPAARPREESSESLQNPQSLPESAERGSPPLSISADRRVSSREVDAAKTSAERVALTFDAGSSAQPVPIILRALAQRGLRCTFFLTGQWIERNPEAARQIAEAGHELGNHSWSHPDFTSLSDEQIREELRRTEEIALRVCGRSTKPLFRPPYGARDERVRSVVAEEGYLTIYWSIDSWDSVKKDITPQYIIDRVTQRIRPGAIVLMHCGSEATAQALPRLLEALEAKGYEVVTVGELLRSSEEAP